MTAMPSPPTSVSATTGRAQRRHSQTRSGSRRTSISAVFLHQLRRTRRSWGSSLAAGLASPTLFLFAIGAGLGSQIDDAELASLGVDSYIDYIGPGVPVVTAMQVAATESLWPTMGLLRWGGVYKAVLATPITSSELGVAHVLWLGFRGMVAASLFLVVLGVAGALGSWLAVFIVAVAVLVAWAHAAPLVALTVGLEQENIFPMISRVVIFPLFLFSGAFFPVEDMPSAVGAFAKITPSWHGVEVARHLALGDMRRADLVHIGYLVAVCAVGFFLVQRQFRKHLDK